MTEIVEISSGKVRGVQQDGIHSFKGIPFAKPPVGALRWRAPEDPDPWTGIRDADRFGSCAMQSTIPGDVGELIGLATHATSEDCLYLNVWTPACDSEKRPVLVWIHGGGNTAGAGSQPRINGEHLARIGDVVVVTCNYRLGVFGFLHAPTLGATGNEALLDQVKALRWVRKEISNFGGDASNVTVFGQSAGGFDIAQMMGMRDAAGCFDKAVPMSGSLRTPLNPDQALEGTSHLAQAFGGLEKLRSVNAEDLLNAQIRLRGQVSSSPVLDGEVIDQDTVKSHAEGRFTQSLPLMIGICRDESTLFTKFDPRNKDLTEGDLLEVLRRRFHDDAAEVLNVYKDDRAEAGLSTEPVDILAARSTDEMFRMPAIKTAECHLQHSDNVWMYRFDHESPAHNGMLQACHSLDIPFVWGTFDIPSMKRFCGEESFVPSLSKNVMSAYLNFAYKGDPNGGSISGWPTYTTETRSTFLFDQELSVSDAPLDGVRKYWMSPS